MITLSLLDKLSESSDQPRTLAEVVDYGVKVAAHTNKANVKTHGFKIFPILSTGQDARFGDMWIRLSEGPDALRAFIKALPSIFEAAKALDKRMVESGEWKPAPTKSQASKAAPATEKPAPKASKSVLDELASDDLPA